MALAGRTDKMKSGSNCSAKPGSNTGCKRKCKSKNAGNCVGKCLGKVLIGLGTLSIIFGIAAIPVCISEVKYLGAPIWSGLFVLITGVVGLMSGHRKTNGWMTAFLVMSVLALMVVVTAAVFTLDGVAEDVGIVEDWDEKDYDKGGLSGWLDEDKLAELKEDGLNLPDGLTEEEIEEWIDRFIPGGDAEEDEGDEEEDDDAETRGRHHHGHHGRPRPDHHGDGHSSDHHEDSHGGSWWDWAEPWLGGDSDSHSDGSSSSHESYKDYDDEKSVYRTSVAMFSVALVIGFLECIAAFASAVAACCGLCKPPSQVGIAPKQVVVLQPGQEFIPGGNGQFVVVQAGYGEKVGVNHGAFPAPLITDFTPSTNPALTVKPTGPPQGRLPPLATAPSYEEAVALPRKDSPAPAYEEAAELPTKISL